MILEKDNVNSCLVSMFNHACYLGRELQKAETAIVSGGEYWQD